MNGLGPRAEEGQEHRNENERAMRGDSAEQRAAHALGLPLE